jgi:hypothetical protein
MLAAEPILVALAHHGLLLKQDKALPSVVGLLTGESLRTSWWSHPKANLIFAVLAHLSNHPDVLVTKLLYRKDTLVHRSLWPALLAVATARKPWQLEGLSPPALSLLQRLDRGDGPIRAIGAPVKQLEARLLAHARDIHTDSGHHEMELESWPTWSARAGTTALPSLPRATAILEHAVSALGAPLKALPWPVASPQKLPRRKA